MDDRTKTGKDDAHQSSKNSPDAALGSASNSGNINNTVNVPGQAKPSNWTVVAIPLIAALISGIGGAYAANRFAVMMAPEKTRAESNTLIGLVKEVMVLTATKQLPPEVNEKLQQIEQQARAVEANAALLQRPAGVASGQADFWVRKSGGVTLGHTTSFGVTAEHPAGFLYIVVNGQQSKMPAGGRVNFKTDAGKNCFVTYTGKSPDSTLYGFKTECGT